VELSTEIGCRLRWEAGAGATTLRGGARKWGCGSLGGGEVGGILGALQGAGSGEAYQEQHTV
jgi:hypothetical protein